MDLSRLTPQWQRITVLVMVGGTALLFSSALPDTFGLPKATVLWLGALVLAALGLARVAWERRVRIPATPWALAVAALGMAALVATLASPNLALSVVGEYNRYTGLLTYAAFAVTGLVVLRTFDVDETALLLRVLTYLLGFIGVYGLLQVLGADPYRVGTTSRGAVATLGNSNLLAGYTAIATPAAVWTVLTRTSTPVLRWAGAAVAAVGLATTIGSRSYQGPAAAVPGILFVLAVWSVTDGGRAARQAVADRLGSLRRAAIGAAVLVVVALVPLAIGVARTGLDQGFIERGAFWRAALRMFGSNPVLGTGFDTYGQHFLAERPAGHAISYGHVQAESAHSVPLNLLAGGGVVVGLAWLALVAVTAWALVRGLRRLDGEERLLLGALGGAWLAYQIQSTVSFDVPELGLLHFVLAGAIVAIGTPPAWRDVALPGRAPRAVGRRGQQRFVVPTGTMVVLAAIAVALLVGAWWSTRPLRADWAAGRAQDRIDSGDRDAAASSLERATSLAPWQGRYWLLRAQLSEASSEVFDAVAFAENAARREPGSAQYALLAGRLNAKYRDAGAARPWFDAALERDPRNPQIQIAVATELVDIDPARAIEELEKAAAAGFPLGYEYAEALARAGRSDDARALLDELLAAGPDDVAGLLRAADVLLALDDRERAADVLLHARELDGSIGVAVEVAGGLERAGRTEDAIAAIERFRYWGDPRVDDLLARLESAAAPPEDQSSSSP